MPWHATAWQGKVTVIGLSVEDPGRQNPPGFRRYRERPECDRSRRCLSVDGDWTGCLEPAIDLGKRRLCLGKALFFQIAGGQASREKEAATLGSGSSKWAVSVCRQQRVCPG